MSKATPTPAQKAAALRLLGKLVDENSCIHEKSVCVPIVAALIAERDAARAERDAMLLTKEELAMLRVVVSASRQFCGRNDEYVVAAQRIVERLGGRTLARRCAGPAQARAAIAALKAQVRR